MANIQQRDLQQEAAQRLEAGVGFGEGIGRIDRWETEDLLTLRERLEADALATGLALESVAQVLAGREVLATD